MTPHSILAVTDFSPSGNNALSRAALLSAQHGATLKIGFLAYPGEASPADASTRLAQHALQLGRRHGIQASALSRISFTARDLLAEVRWADLVVWGTAPARSLRSFFVGEPVEQILRTAKRPVFVVRREAKHDYRSLIVAVDFTPASRALVNFSFALNKSAQVELFHAVSTANERKLRHAEVSDHAISGSELIVVGRHPSSRLRDLFFESTANRILGCSTTDVLVVPHDYEPASGATAAKRLAIDSPAVRRVRAGAPEPPALPNPAAMFVRP